MEALIGLIVVEPKSPTQGIPNEIVSIALWNASGEVRVGVVSPEKAGSLRNDAG